MPFMSLGRVAAPALVLALALSSSGGVSAAPLAPLPLVDTATAAPLVLVAGGCGFGEHRGPFGGCRINNGWRGRLRAAETGLPRGCPPGMHRGYYGRCHY